MRAPLPADEAARLTSLHGYEILDTPPEQVFEDLVRLASTVSGMPVALISLVDAERQWFKARLGLDLHETPRELSFCSHAILEDGVFVVEDASRDPRFADNPYVTGDPRIRFYAGAPIRTHDGHSLGTVCVLGQVPSSFRPEQRRALSELAALVADQLEQRAAARKLRRELAAERGPAADGDRQPAVRPLDARPGAPVRAAESGCPRAPGRPPGDTAAGGRCPG